MADEKPIRRLSVDGNGTGDDCCINKSRSCHYVVKFISGPHIGTTSYEPILLPLEPCECAQLESPLMSGMSDDDVKKGYKTLSQKIETEIHIKEAKSSIKAVIAELQKVAEIQRNDIATSLIKEHQDKKKTNLKWKTL